MMEISWLIDILQMCKEICKQFYELADYKRQIFFIVNHVVEMPTNTKPKKHTDMCADDMLYRTTRLTGNWILYENALNPFQVWKATNVELIVLDHT